MPLASALLPLLHRLPPEYAHQLSLQALRFGLVGHRRSEDDPALSIRALGIQFRSPLGLAAGFDKNAMALRGLGRLGFAFIETGTVTLRPQAGNPRPRLFRLDADRAIVNRMGFNNKGLESYLSRLRALRHSHVQIGANLGINKEGAKPERDYPFLLAAVAPYVNYAVINVSSPNTPGLRDLQRQERLHSILSALSVQVPQRPPIVVKISPDLGPEALEAVIETCIGSGVEGLIVSNTTISRPESLTSPLAQEVGGLSGAPLFRISTGVLARAHLLARGRLCLIGVGGVFSGRDAFVKIQAGASLVQLYTSFVYHGPALIPRLKAELATVLREAGFRSVHEAIGSDARRLAGTA